MDRSFADASTGDEGASRPGPAAGRRAVPIAAAVVLILGLAVLAVFAWRYLDQRGRQDLASQRDQAVEVASQALVNAYSFDYRTVDTALQQLQDSSTGDFLEQQKQWAPDVRKRVAEQKAVTRASVGNAAVEAFDPGAGTAKVLLVFTADSKRENLPDVTARQAATVELAKVDGAWKVSVLTPVGVIVPVGSSSASVQELGGAPTPAPGSSAPITSTR